MVANFSKKQKEELSGSKLAFQIVGVVFFAIVIILILADFKMYAKKRELVLKIDDYKKQISDIEKNSDILKNEIANSSNKDYIEKIAYEQLNEQKPGETEYIFVSGQNQTQVPVKAVGNSGNYRLGWLSSWWSWIKSKF